MIKIVAISDTHGQEVKNLPKGDLLIHSGDWSGIGNYQDTNKFLIWMGKVRLNYKKVVVVPGNHDKWIEMNLPLAKEEFKALDIDLLVCQETFFQNQLIYGMPYTPEFMNWGFMANDIERADYCDAIPPDTSVLVTHGPPQGYLDTLAANGSDPGMEAGCQHLKLAVQRIQPSVHVFGHIHEGGGMTTLGKTLLVNASCMDEYYRLVNGFKVIYL